VSERPEISARLVLLGDFDPDKVTGALELEPTQVWHRGDTWTPARVRETNGWQFWVGPERSYDLGGQLRYLLDLLREKKEAISWLRDNFTTEMRVDCVAYFDERTPGLELDASSLVELGELGLSIDVDYIPCDLDEDDPDRLNERHDKRPLRPAE